ncbi:FAD-dependent monooxygenase [Aeromicrobium fastidiosum]|uniref:FAD-dependent monooxygenase n=1 Tax=Aeromicrobium fastidiosum TaxID=52699 RepID=UPI002023490F|nr:FAD-dependent monooxygenase [Aeromicrobium fastidiosum]MCL8250450.1 FAD-dependent monooxygenase [Aeromicrobium fastidiosum]
MTEQQRVLVTGASVAGPAAAFWLDRAGYDVTVVEKAPELRPGGQNIDVRATGRDVLRLMGLEDAVRNRNTGEIGTRFVAEDGTVVSEFGVQEGDGHDGPTAELEILRGALSQILVEACPDGVTWRFGTSITAVVDGPDGVEVELSDGTRDRFDLLVVAEGVGSHTRGLVFGDEPQEKALGMYCSYATIERTADDDRWWNWLVVPGGRQAGLRPDDEGTTRAMLNFVVDSPTLEGLDGRQLRAALRDEFSGVGWQVPRILDGLDDSDDLYVDYLRQIMCPTWHRGRVVLLGDAAWCVTPVGGGGTSLAITGAYVLAAALSRASEDGTDHTAALDEFEQWMRPLVEDAQDLPPGVPKAAAPQTRVGAQLLKWGTKVAATPLVQGLASRLTSGPEAGRELPRFVDAAAR